MTTKNDLWIHDPPEGAPFRDFVKLAFSRLKLCPREGILYILMHNDPNGVWRDEDSIREFGKPITKAEAIQHYAAALGEFGGVPKDWTVLNEEELKWKLMN